MDGRLGDREPGSSRELDALTVGEIKGRVGRWRDGSEEWVSHHATSGEVDITARATDPMCWVVVTSRREWGKVKRLSGLPWSDHELDAER